MLEGRNLACTRGGRLVFGRIGFDLRPGETLVVTGPNGSGKSTLLRLMAGLLPPTGGELLWDGLPVRDEPETFHRHIHYCGHLDAIKPTLTVTENVAFWIRLRGADPARLTPALEAFGLSDLRDLPAQVLSAGQRRRLGLCRLLAVPARLWLLDEPTVALDPESVTRLMNVLATHAAGAGITALATNVPLPVEQATTLRLAPGGEDDEEGESFWS